MLQGALNGDLSRAAHPAVPLTAAELARDAAACVAAGAVEFHVHPRDGDGRETLDPAVVDAVVLEVRAAAGVPVGVSTGAWIEPDPERRAALVARWRAPDHASVNFSEEGAAEVARALLAAGVGVEAAVWTLDDVERLAASGVAPRALRVLLEPGAEATVETAAALHAALDAHGIAAPRLQHGDGASAWPLLRDAVARGIATRIGLEDVRELPDGAPAPGNAALVQAARALGA